MCQCMVHSHTNTVIHSYVCHITSPFSTMTDALETRDFMFGPFGHIHVCLISIKSTSALTHNNNSLPPIGEIRRLIYTHIAADEVVLFQKTAYQFVRGSSGEPLFSFWLFVKRFSILNILCCMNNRHIILHLHSAGKVNFDYLE